MVGTGRCDRTISLVAIAGCRIWHTPLPVQRRPRADRRLPIHQGQKNEGSLQNLVNWSYGAVEMLSPQASEVGLHGALMGNPPIEAFWPEFGAPEDPDTGAPRTQQRESLSRES
jgi:hypothetical protein